MTKVKKAKAKTTTKVKVKPDALAMPPFPPAEISPAVRPKKPVTPFEAAETPLERLEVARGGKSLELRPVHPSELEITKADFLKTYALNKGDVNFRYDEGGLQLFITWK